MKTFAELGRLAGCLRLVWPALVCAFLAVNAAAQGVASLQLVPSVISGGSGASATGIVTLSAPAPAGGSTVRLDSSLHELATSAPQIVVPAGQTTANFVLATNGMYRRYSGLAFTANISAVNPLAGGTVSATLSVTAQARPADPVFNPRSDRSGTACAGESGTLWNCPAASPENINPQCTFRQECTLGCENRQGGGTTLNDACAAAGPYPIALNPRRLIGGNRGAGTFQLSSAATAGSTGLAVTDSLVAAEPTRLNIPIPTGVTSHPFDVYTAAVNRVHFAPFTGRTITLQSIAGGGTFYQYREGLTWLSVVPGAAPPVTLASLGLSTPSVVGGQVAFASACIDQLAPAIEIARTTFSFSSSHPAVAPVRPAQADLAPGSICQGFSVDTLAVASDTTMTIRAQLGTQALTVPLLATATPVATQVASFFLDPNIVTGGQTSRAMLLINGRAPSNGFTVTLSNDNPTAALVPASVTVPGAADRVSFDIPTHGVAADVLANLGAQPGDITTRVQLHVRVPVGAPALSSVAVTPASVVGGSTSTGTVTLSGATSVAAVVTLASNVGAATVPASVTVPAGASTATFVVNTTGVAANTVATLSASLGTAGITQLATLTITSGTDPAAAPAAPSLLSPANDANPAQPVTLDWSDVATATSYEVQIDNSSTIASPFVANPAVTTSQLSIGGLPAQRLWWRVRALNAAGVFGPFSSTRRFTPQAAPAAPSLSAVAVNPTSVVGPASSTGTVTLTAAAPAGGAVVTLASSNAAAAGVPASVTVAAGASSASFNVTTTTVTANTGVTLTGSYSAVSRTAILTVTPVPPPASLSGLALNPASVTGGSPSTATVTLSSAAPAGGALVTLSSNAPAATAVPANISLPSGATSASFSVATSAVAAVTTATISAIYSGVTRTAALAVNPINPPGTNVTLTVTATGRSGETVTSSPAGVNVTVGSSGSASFATNTAITLSAASGRDAIWSGACSSGGSKAKTCVFTITGNVSVTGNVQ